MQARYLLTILASFVASIALTGCSTSPAHKVTTKVRLADLPAFASLQMANKDAAWGVSSTGSLWRTTDARRSWRYITLPGVPHSSISQVVDPIGVRTAWVAASSDSIVADRLSGPVLLFRTTNGGRTWRAMPKPPDAAGLPLVGSLDFLNAEDGWLILQAPHGMGSSPGVLYRTNDGGASWQGVSRTSIMNVSPGAPPAPTLPVAGQVEFTSPQAGWLVGGPISTGPRSLYATTDGGVHWRTAPLPTVPAGATFDSVVAAPRSDGNLLTVPIAYQDASGQTGVALLRSSDRGQTWEAGALLAGGADISLLSAHVALALRLGDYDPLHPDRNVPASLWRTDDGGVTWQLVANLSRALKSQLAGPLVEISMTFLTVRTGVVWATQYNAPGAQRTLWLDETTDGGRTWIPRWPTARH